MKTASRWKDPKWGAVMRTCCICGKEFKAYKSVVRKGKALYCSTRCARGPGQTRVWRLIKNDGYAYIKHFTHPNRGSKNRVVEHRFVVEQAIGRYLRGRPEKVHHINGVRTDNRLCNLFLCHNESEHKWAHTVRPQFLRALNKIRYIKWNLEGEKWIPALQNNG